MGWWLSMAVRLERITIAVVLCAIMAAGTAQAAGLTYSEQAKDIKVGILLTAGLNADPNYRPNPYTFFVMDRREDLKPAGWNLYNPQASSHVTPDIVARWGTIYNVGDPVDKGMGCYWEVNIGDTSPDELAQYDVLLLTGYADATGAPNISFNSREREKLRKFVDNGGVLWVEYRHTVIAGSHWRTRMDPADPSNPSNFFIPSVTFSSGGVGMSFPALAPPQSRAHSLLNRPFLLLPTDMYGLGGYDDPTLQGTEYISAAAGTEAAKTFLPIVMRGSNTTVAAVQYGSGHVVICADGVGQAISEPVGLGKDSSGIYNGRCGQLFMAAHPEDLKFAYNIVSLGSEHTTFHKNARRSGYSFAEIGAPLVPLWTFGLSGATGIVNDAAPAILDDVVFSVGLGKVETNLGTGSYQIMNDGNYYLRALDISPTRDRDMDGDPDDGLRDNSLGAPFDVLWQYQLDGIASPPTAAYAPIGGGSIVPAVFVVTKSGRVLGFDSSTTNYDLTGKIGNPEEYFPDPTKKPTAFTNPINANGNIPAPTYAGGALYAAGGDGAIHVHNLFDSSGGSDWKHPTTAMNFGPPSAPIVGYFFDPTSGATEQIIYIATFGNPGSNTGSVRSYPLRSFNEVLTPVTPGKKDGRYRSRSSNTFIAAGAWALYYRTDVNAPPILIDGSKAQISTTMPIYFEITDVPTRDLIFDNGYTVLADYSLDFWTNPTATPFRQIAIDHPSSVTDYAGITGSPAVGKNDTLYFGTENGLFYAVRESGRGSNIFVPQVVKWRWYIGDPPAQQMLGLTLANVRSEVQIVGSPVVVGDMVYFAVNHVPTKQGYILAFKADPVFTVQLLQPPIKVGTPLSVQQFNILRDPSASAPVSFQGASAGDAERASPGTPFLIDYDSGKLTFINFRTRGQQELSASADFQVVYTWNDPNNPNPPAITETHSIINPTAPDKWNNLAWFIKLLSPNPAVGPLMISSSPTVMGDVLYVGCENGFLCSMDLDAANQSSSMSGNRWEKEWKPNSNFIWADKIGGADAVTAAVAGSHGMLAVTTAAGLKVLYNPVSLVADANRLVEVDASGNLLWTCDATIGFAGTWAQTSAGGSGAVYASENVPFNRPSVVRRGAAGGLVVADTGNNRVVHVDKGGQILFQVTDFEEMDPNNPLLPPGSPLEISRPTDVSTWVSMEPEDWTNPSSTLRPAYHYLIADSGNYRVVEVVYRYDASVGRYRRVLGKVSQNLVEGKKYRFLTARITAYVQYGPNQSGPGLVVCAVSNQDTGQEGVDPTGGSLIKLDWAGSTGVPGTVIGTVGGLPVDAPANRLVNPTFYTRQFVGSNEYVDIAIDAKGIHTARVIIGGPAPVVRSYGRTDHWDIDETNATPTPIPDPNTGQPHPRPFAPSYAQYLPNGNLLVTNKATGTIYYMDKTGVVKSAASYGELFELEPDATLPTKWARVPGTCIPNYANTGLRNPALMHQPLSAERLMY